MSNYTFIDLFSGLGGFRIAFEQSGAKCVFSSDNDPHVQKVYLDNFGEKPKGDITQIDEIDIPKHDILCGGFPCQPFSIGGYRKGFSDTRGTLFFDIERILRAKKPRAFILENVKGLINHDKGRTFNTILDTLASKVNGETYPDNNPRNLGYNVFHKVLNSSDFNIPQNRERIFIVGFLDQDTSFKFPRKKKLSKSLNSIIEQDVNLEEYGVSKTVNSHLDHHTKEKNKDISNENLIAYEIRPSRCSFRDDGLSPCLTAKMGTGGNNVPILVSKRRKLTVNECLKLQGFPEGYLIKENTMQSYKQVGNSVSVPVVSLLAKEIIKILNSTSV